MPDDIRIRPAGDADAAAWNDFLDRQPEASPLARYEWRAILAESYGVDTRFLLADRGGDIAGVLPAYIVRSPRGRRRLYSTRFGLVAGTSAAAAALLDHVDALAADEGLTATLVTSGWHAVTARPASYTRTTVALTLADEQAMWGGLRDKTRNMVRKAERAGITIDQGPQYVDALYDHYAANMLRLGVPIHSRRFFHVTLHHLAGQSTVLAALHEGRPVASMLLHFGRRVACYPYQNALYDFRKLAPVQALNWAAMRLCAERGMTVLDMGESRAGGPVYQSKTNFGGQPREVFYFDSAPAAAAAPAAGAPTVSASRRLERFLLERSPIAVRRLAAQARLRWGRIL